MKKKLVILIIIISSFVYFDLNQNKTVFNEVKINITKNNSNYIEVNNSKDFLDALDNENIKIINIISDLDLGYNMIEESKNLEKHNKALTHPLLKDTGVSKLLLKNRDGLIIKSSNGSKILHCNIVIDNSKIN